MHLDDKGKLKYCLLEEKGTGSERRAAVIRGAEVKRTGNRQRIRSSSINKEHYELNENQRAQEISGSGTGG